MGSCQKQTRTPPRPLVLSLCHESPLFQVDSVRTRGLGGVLVCFWQDCPPVFLFIGGLFPDQPHPFCLWAGFWFISIWEGIKVLFLFSLLSLGGVFSFPPCSFFPQVWIQG